MIECKCSVRFWWPPWSQDSFSAQTVLELICTSVDLFFSLSSNRVFVVETFTMLISQKQTLVSSDTSCAVGKRRDFFVRSHSVSSLFFSFFFLISCYTFSANTDWAPQSTDQQRWRRSGSKNVFVMNDFTRTPLSTSTAPSKPSFQVVPLHKQAHLSRTHSALASFPACSMWLKLQEEPPSMLPRSLLSTFGAVHRDSWQSDSAVYH